MNAIDYNDKIIEKLAKIYPELAARICNASVNKELNFERWFTTDTAGIPERFYYLHFEKRVPHAINYNNYVAVISYWNEYNNHDGFLLIGTHKGITDLASIELADRPSDETINPGNFID